MDGYRKAKGAGFVVGQAVDANGYIGRIKAIHTGKLLGMADVRLPGGIACVSLSEVVPLPDEGKSDLVVGALVYGDWGAMFPRWTGRIVEVGPQDCMIEWDEIWESGPSRYEVKTLPPDGGSPVGVYLDRRGMIRAATTFTYPLAEGEEAAVLKALVDHKKATIGSWMFTVDDGWVWGCDAYGVDYVAAQEISAAGVEKILAGIKRQNESTEPHPAEYSH